MKDVFIVLVIINDTVEVDSVFWNEKKAFRRWNEIMNFSDGTAYVLKKWVNPKIVLLAKEYTYKRAIRLKMPPFFPLLVDFRKQEPAAEPKMTNADRIRNMSDEELAKFIHAVGCNSHYGDDCGYPFCHSMEGNLCHGIKDNTDARTLKWLKSEVVKE